MCLLLCTYTRICRMAPYLPKMSYISSEVILYGKFRMYSTRFTSGGSRICKAKVQTAETKDTHPPNKGQRRRRRLDVWQLFMLCTDGICEVIGGHCLLLHLRCSASAGPEPWLCVGCDAFASLAPSECENCGTDGGCPAVVRSGAVCGGRARRFVAIVLFSFPAHQHQTYMQAK